MTTPTDTPNQNGKEVEFRGGCVYVERDRAPFDTYLCGRLLTGDDGFARFYPVTGVALHVSLLRSIARQLSEINEKGMRP